MQFARLFPHRAHVRQFGTYVLNGIAANGVDIGGFYMLERMGVWYVTASIVSGLCGFLTAFFLHKYIAFKKHGTTTRHFMRFSLLGMFNLYAVAAVLYVCVEWLGVSELPAKVIANGSQVTWNFLLMKFLVYI